MDVASDWGDVSSLVLLLMVLVTDALVGTLPGLRVVCDAPLNAIRGLTRWVDGRLNRVQRGGETRRLRGLFVVLVVALLAWVIGIILSAVAREMPQGWMLEAAALFALLRQRDSIGRMRRGWQQLAAGHFDEARSSVAPLVRYDVQALDNFGVARAAIEGGMARFTDRFLATVFWYLLFGLPGILVCRSVNAVADIIGRNSSRHASFGFVAARVDYILNLAPAIIAGPVVSIAAIFVPRTSASAAFKGWINDLRARGTRSEFRDEGAMAGALGLALGGPRPFGDETIAGAWVGDGRARATVSDIQRAIFLISIACLLISVALALAFIARNGQ
jgi:adenosylcobinamide-phosphate synthase